MIRGNCVLIPFLRWLRGKRVTSIRRFPRNDRYECLHLMWKEDGVWYHFKAYEDRLLGWSLWFTGTIELVSKRTMNRFK
jgi:hypothetical protein